MNRIMILRFLTVLVIPISLVSARPLDIYLPRTVQIDGDVIELGRVGIFSGPEDLAARARAVPLGRFSIPGQQITLDRVTIESCLAGSGIASRQVRFSGAERIVVSRNERELTGLQLIAAARSFLETQMAGQEAVILDPEQVPKGYLSQGSALIEVVPLAGQDRILGKRTVLLSLRQEGLEVGRVPVHFEVRFHSRQAVASADIAAGQAIREDLIRFETVQTREPQSTDPAIFAGATAKRAIAAGSVIHPDWLQPPAPPVLVQKRQKVFLKLEVGLMLITASGEAMDEGTAGQVVRVKRGQRPEERIVLGTVMPDGTVQPILERGF